MKKKLLAIIAVVAMIATLLVPMFAVSAEEGKIVFALGEITYNAEDNEIAVPLNIVEQVNVEELEGLYAAEIYLVSDQGLECSYIDEGTISDTYNDGKKDKEFGFSYTPNPALNKLVIDSSVAECGIKTTGLVATFYYTAPADFDEADINDYTFSFAFDSNPNDTVSEPNTMMICFKNNTRVPAVLLCNHSSVKEVVVKEAECEVAGEKKTVCKACGEDVKTGIVIPATGHDMVEAPGTSATCTQGGTIVKECANGCGKTETTQGAALGHDWVEDPDAYVAPGCETEGKKVEVCSRAAECGVAPKETVIPATGHAYESDQLQSTAPDCVNDGKVVDVCGTCGDVEETVIPKLGHDFNGDITIIEEATVDAEGKMTVGCTRCDEVEERAIPKLVTEVGGADNEFSIKVEDDKAIPADTEIVGAEVDEKLEGVDGLDIVGGFTFATKTSEMDLAEVKGEVSIDLGDIAKAYNKITIGVINAEGKVEKVEATIADGKAVFNGALGATYVVMGEEIVVEDEKPSSDKTADIFSVVLYVAAALVAAAGVVVIAKKRFAL